MRMVGNIDNKTALGYKLMTEEDRLYLNTKEA